MEICCDEGMHGEYGSQRIEESHLNESGLRDELELIKANMVYLSHQVYYSFIFQFWQWTASKF